MSAFHPLQTLRAHVSFGRMKVISLNASGWRSPEDFYSALLPQLGAPTWHGRNLDALEDSLRGGVNQLGPPFTVQVERADSLPEPMRDFLGEVASVFSDVHDETRQDIAFQVV